MATTKKQKIIEGVNAQGDKFRPSDWAERMSCYLSTVKGKKLRYSPLLIPSVKSGNACLLVDETLKDSDPELYQHIIAFAESNKLKICDAEDQSNVNDL